MSGAPGSWRLGRRSAPWREDQHPWSTSHLPLSQDAKMPGFRPGCASLLPAKAPTHRQWHLLPEAFRSLLLGLFSIQFTLGLQGQSGVSQGPGASLSQHFPFGGGALHLLPFTQLHPALAPSPQLSLAPQQGPACPRTPGVPAAVLITVPTAPTPPFLPSAIPRLALPHFHCHSQASPTPFPAIIVALSIKHKHLTLDYFEIP